MTNDELYDLIVEKLNVDTYQNNIEFKGRKLAEDLERILYICPICKEKHTLHSKDNFISCSNCNTQITVNNYLQLQSNNQKFNFRYIHEWYDYQVEEIKKEEFDDGLIYQDQVKLFLTKESQPKKLIGKGYMNMFKDNISFDIEDGKRTLDFSSIVAITLVGKKKMNIYCKDSTYQVVNNGKTNFLKYMHLYYILENRKEGNENGFIGI